MKPLSLANPFIDRPAALRAMWERDGYLFFRGVLDIAAIDELRRDYLDGLVGRGVVDPGAVHPVWNGASLEGFYPRFEAIEKSGALERFVATPTVHAVFAQILGEEPYWVPMPVCRALPPMPGRKVGDPLLMPHQDGFHNRGLGFRVAWIPLMHIDEATGGLAVAEGWHRRGFIHDPDDAPHYRVTHSPVPNEDWRRADYAPGDVVVFDIMTPHSGLANRSDRFRLSVDLRVLPSSAPRPTIGSVSALTPDSVTVRADSGDEVTLTIDDESFLRPLSQLAVGRTELPAVVPLGHRIIVGHAEGRVTVLRPVP